MLAFIYLAYQMMSLLLEVFCGLLFEIGLPKQQICKSSTSGSESRIALMLIQDSTQVARTSYNQSLSSAKKSPVPLLTLAPSYSVVEV
jgi:hypothetical protein